MGSTREEKLRGISDDTRRWRRGDYSTEYYGPFTPQLGRVAIHQSSMVWIVPLLLLCLIQWLPLEPKHLLGCGENNIRHTSKTDQQWYTECSWFGSVSILVTTDALRPATTERVVWSVFRVSTGPLTTWSAGPCWCVHGKR